MADITRRRALGFAGGALGLGACSLNAGSDINPLEMPEAYAGEIAFEHGVASGDPMSDSVVIWTRVTPKSGTGTIPVVYRVKLGDKLVATGSLQTSAARDFTVKVIAEGLAPATRYSYEFLVPTVDGDVTSPTGTTKTTAEPGSDTPVRFAVVSCSNWPFGYFNAYREISKYDDLDAVLHLGDYFYEYGVDGYGGQVGEALGRRHDPITEIVTLDDYRTRHAQYKTDPDLQAAHAIAPWLCTWDDHESTNNSYRTGAQNHNPEENEGDWTTRKQHAVQAYLEWMPVRDPEPGRVKEAIYRRFQFGSVATVFCLESRLTGRSEEISWFTELGGLEPMDVPAKAVATMAAVQSDERTMLGAQQEAWLSEGLSESVAEGTQWQVLANQVVMARVVPPKFAETLTPQQIDDLDNVYLNQLVGFSQLGLPMNLDAWDGFPAARARLYETAKAAGARLVTVTGDTHTAWANTLIDVDGEQRGVEFGCTSITSPGFGSYMDGVDGLGEMFADANSEVEYHDPHGHGFTLLTLTKAGVRGDYVKVSTITEKDYTAETSVRFATRAEGAGMTRLAKV
ncbi:MAG: alkaline phosphatase D family protein [Hyphomonadaceae bacterium]|nr:alkaline phosphatase D family protein [Hyphomonadaceae bacterium]